MVPSFTKIPKHETYTGMPHFSKVCIVPLHFHKRPMLIPIFAKNNRNLERIFAFLQMKAKSKVAFRAGLAAAVTEQCAP